jgi:hypothetical protein
MPEYNWPDKSEPSEPDVRFVCRTEQIAGRSSAWLERQLWELDVAGSNPVAPTLRFRGPLGRANSCKKFNVGAPAPRRVMRG